MQIYLNNNNVVELYNLRNNVDDTLIDDATVNLTIYDSSEVPVGGGIWPAAMDNRAPGRYRVTLEETLLFERGRKYVGVITAKDTEGRQGEWEVELMAQANKVY